MSEKVPFQRTTCNEQSAIQKLFHHSKKLKAFKRELITLVLVLAASLLIFGIMEMFL